jgi:hypothetical protein
MMSMLLAGIFPAKQTQQKGMECSEKKKKRSHEPITFVFLAFWEPMISYNFLWQGLECSKISSHIIRTHKNPLRRHDFFLLDPIKKKLKFMGM